jgi:putative ABC transport system permease protein
MGLNMDINTTLDIALAEQGRRISIFNGEIDDGDNLIMQQPGRFTPDVISILASDYENLSDITFVAEAWLKPIIWEGDKTYEIRSAVQTDETYADLMNLEFAAGRFFGKADVESRQRVVVISALAGQMLFGPPEVSLGKTVALAGRDGVNSYTVVGVFKDVSDMEREAYGIADFIFPILSGIPLGTRIHPVQRGAILMARIASDNIEKAESRIRAILEQEYGDDLILGVWEGIPNNTAAALIEESRKSVSNFALAVSILGFIILATSSIGIFSVMLVEVLNRTREIGLRRSLGTTRAGIRRLFIVQALYYSLIGSLFGSALAVALYRPVGIFLTPLFDSAGFRASDIAFTVPGPLPFSIAIGAALVFGALFGFFPALSAARTPIVECIREETA